MAGTLVITEKWIREKLKLQIDNLDAVRSLALPGSYHIKITHLGRSLMGFTRLKHLDLSRNSLECLEGLDHLSSLETLNIYYNKVPNLKEIFRLRHNTKLKELDLRLNPVTQQEPDYRLFIVHMLLDLQLLDDRRVSDEERKSAILFFDTDQAYEFDKSIQKENKCPTPPNSRSSPVGNPTIQSRLNLTKAVAPLRKGLGADTEELLELFAERGDHLFINELTPPTRRSAKRKILANKTTPTSGVKNNKDEKSITPTKTENTQQQHGLNFTPHPQTVAMDTVTMPTNKGENENDQIIKTPQKDFKKDALADTVTSSKLPVQVFKDNENGGNSQTITKQGTEDMTSLISNITLQQSKIERTLTQLTNSLTQLLNHSSQLQSVVVMLQESHKSLISSNQQLVHELNEVKIRHSQEVSQLSTNYNTLRKLVHERLHL